MLEVSASCFVLSTGSRWLRHARARFVKLSILGSGTALLAVAALCTLALTLQQQRALSASDRYYDVFAMHEMRAALQQARIDLSHDATPAGRSRVSLELHDLVDHARTLQDSLGSEAGARPEVEATLSGLTTDLSTALGLLSGSGETATAASLDRLLARQALAVGRLGSSTYWIFAANAADEANRLTSLYWTGSLVIAALIVCAAGLITLLQRQRRRAEHMALHDQLTGLPNRLLFRRKLEEALLVPNVVGDGASVIFLDLDDFKDVNDSLGHIAGDQMLCAMTRRLLLAVPHGVVARLGGDEFAVLLPHGGRAGASDTAARLSMLLSAPVNFGTAQAITSVSIGVTCRRGDADTATGLLQQADLAMYEAKASGRGGLYFFDAELGDRLQTRLTIEADLREALLSDQFSIAYQPLIELGTRKIIGFEALMRWTHPVRGPVPPVAFIPVAESTGLILPLGEMVLSMACCEAATWPGNTKVAVNLSPRQFKTDLVGIVRNALQSSGLAPQRLELEITESALLQDGDGVQATLHALHALGVRLALDDFGTGYSSLSYLQRFPFDKIKVDQSFVRSMPQRPESAAIVELITALAKRLGMTTTAEGIEDEQLLMMVRNAGCTEGQGYHFDRPLAPAQAMSRLLDNLRQQAVSVPVLGNV